MPTPPEPAYLDACLAENLRIRAILTELRALMVDGNHPVNRRQGYWARAPQSWVDLVDSALEGPA